MCFMICIVCQYIQAVSERAQKCVFFIAVQTSWVHSSCHARWQSTTQLTTTCAINKPGKHLLLFFLVDVAHKNRSSRLLYSSESATVKWWKEPWVDLKPHLNPIQINLACSSSSSNSSSADGDNGGDDGWFFLVYPSSPYSDQFFSIYTTIFYQTELFHSFLFFFVHIQIHTKCIISHITIITASKDSSTSCLVYII